MNKALARLSRMKLVNDELTKKTKLLASTRLKLGMKGTVVDRVMGQRDDLKEQVRG